MKTTRKEIYRIYGKESVISLGYCKIQSIVNYLTKIGHTERLEGWAADIYELPEPYNDIVVCTGYAPFGTSSEKRVKCANDGKNYIITTIIRNAKEWLNDLRVNYTKQLTTNKAACNMFGVMLLLFGTVIFISGTDPKKIKDFINKSDESDKF